MAGGDSIAAPIWDSGPLSTHGNAVEAAEWARSHDYRSLVVVTANYHMPRSLHEFSAQMPDIALLPYPVAEDNVDLGGWWSHPHTLRILHVEYAKYLAACFSPRWAARPRIARPATAPHAA